ncbi:unnamed protein product [Adineta steineri]|uniref:Thioredoxin domain-containing protein n=1 Tax=Adineta steineri TaxID=433720 RepID=A0A813WBI2_9BILA|nr:unnamed protein product [Adineta steineri]CAF0946548.1 unnamed protein product [Adineta steineri]
MSFNKLVLISLLIFLPNVLSDVIPLTSANISQYLQNHVTFVKFYANWCPHCKKFEPTWKHFSEAKQNNDLQIAEVDCSEEPLLCSDHDVFGYPTIKLFVHGSGARYEGPRHVDSLEAFYREKIAEDANFEDSVATKTAVSELTSDNFVQRISKNFAFVVFYAPWCKHCKVLKPIFQELAQQMINTEGLLFATVDCTTQKNLCAEHAIRGYPSLIWFHNGVEKDRYIEARQLEKMRNYIEQNMKVAEQLTTQAPPIVDQSEEIIEPSSTDTTVLNAKTFTQGVSFEGYAFINFGAPWCSHCQKLAPIWKQLAQRFAHYEEIRIARVDCTASENLCRDYGIRAFPSLILFRYGESKVEYNGARDYESLINFLISQLEFFGDEYILKQENEIKNE